MKNTTNESTISLEKRMIDALLELHFPDETKNGTPIDFKKLTGERRTKFVADISEAKKSFIDLFEGDKRTHELFISFLSLACE